jgi:hypothetical protein
MGASVRWLTWCNVRALLVAIALVVHGIYALPLPREITLEKLQDDAGTENVDRWMGWFAMVGYHPDRAWFEQTVCDVSRGFDRFHKALKAPAKPWMQLSGNSQSWALFAIPERWPIRLEVRIMRTGQKDWEMLYRRLDPALTAWDEVLIYRRMRGVWDGQVVKPKSGYKNLTKWLARRIFEQDETIARIEVRGVRSHTTLPDEPADLETKIFGVRPHRRENHVPVPAPVAAP